jgi:hypothetical protein
MAPGFRKYPYGTLVLLHPSFVVHKNFQKMWRLPVLDQTIRPKQAYSEQLLILIFDFRAQGQD